MKYEIIEKYYFFFSFLSFFCLFWSLPPICKLGFTEGIRKRKKNNNQSNNINKFILKVAIVCIFSWIHRLKFVQATILRKMIQKTQKLKLFSKIGWTASPINSFRSVNKFVEWLTSFFQISCCHFMIIVRRELMNMIDFVVLSKSPIPNWISGIQKITMKVKTIITSIITPA